MMDKKAALYILQCLMGLLFPDPEDNTDKNNEDSASDANISETRVNTDDTDRLDELDHAVNDPCESAQPANNALLGDADEMSLS